jgi:hypothetical protein
MTISFVAGRNRLDSPCVLAEKSLFRSQAYTFAVFPNMKPICEVKFITLLGFCVVWWYALSDRQGSKFQGAVFNVGGILDVRE